MRKFIKYTEESASLVHGFRGFSSWMVGFNASEPLVRQNVTVGMCDRGNSLSHVRGGKREGATLLQQHAPDVQKLSL